MNNPKSNSDTDPRIIFGKRLASLRKELGWSQEKLAIESGVARSYLSGLSAVLEILHF